VEIGHVVPHLKARVLDGAREAVPGAGAAEREEVAAGLEDAEALGCEVDTGRQVVPLASHEAEPVGRVRDHRVHARVGQRAHHLDAVARVEGHGVVSVVDAHGCTSRTSARPQAMARQQKA
jgi:hypothetical protein